jgi:hypothetical protein
MPIAPPPSVNPAVPVTPPPSAQRPEAISPARRAIADPNAATRETPGGKRRRRRDTPGDLDLDA